MYQMYLRRHIPRNVFLMTMLVGSMAFIAACGGFGLERIGFDVSTPTPVIEDDVIQNFLDSGPRIGDNTTSTTIEREVGLPLTNQQVRLPDGLPLPTTDSLELEGTIYIVGSPALAPLTRALYSGFIFDGYRDVIRIEEVGHNIGFDLYCQQAVVDIVMSVQPISQEQLTACIEQNRQPVALRVGLDAITIIGNPNLTFLDNVSQKDLVKIFTENLWSDVRSDWPDEEIRRFIPDADSHEFQFFVTKIFKHDQSAILNGPAVTVMQDEADLALAVSDTPYAISFSTYRTYLRHAQDLKLIGIDNLTPTFLSMTNGVYPLIRPLLLYTDADTLQNKPQVSAFLMYYLSNMNNVILETGTFPVNETIFERSKVILLNALGQEGYLDKFIPTSTPIPPTQTPIYTKQNTGIITRITPVP